MNVKIGNIIKNISYTLSSNFISLMISTLVILIIPKVIGVKEYGYWQLYIFYASYVGFFQFGWNDGIYLRYGGEKYEKLNKNLFYSQFWMLFITQLILAALISTAALFFIHDPDRLFITIMSSFSMVVIGVRAMPLFILQATSRIKEYALITTIDRISYIFLIIAALITGTRNYKILITADLFGKLLSLFLASYYCKDIVFRKISSFILNISEIMNNIKVGIKLMIANISSMLIIGIVRLGIERSWDIATFGKISLTLSISNLMMVFINAIGIIIFPMLRNTSEERLPLIYETLRDILMSLSFFLLILYYPIREVVTTWLPNYAESFKYMALLFPMIIYEGKMALLVNTYFKTLRKEQIMLNINFISMTLSIVVTFVTTQLFKNLDFAVLSILLLLIFRASFSELFLSKILKISLKKDVLFEWILTFIFVFLGWMFDSWLSLFVYLIIFCLYLILKRKDYKTSMRNIKSFLKNPT